MTVVFGVLGSALATRIPVPNQCLLHRAGFTHGEITQEHCTTTPTSENA